ncbi:MAG: 30S ribosomal protein S9 [Myxococcales bacterium]|nr:30S ribosomal protein S9 [Myxococcales bacterium]MDH5306485.1 30S ribosomal protein S9 [Myxococcales bacterium]MDH5565664.1 30S ribosomal protein S9 [Myxococcales bacterium]
MAEAMTTVCSTGKRKTCIARVRMHLGSGTIIVNGRSLEDYFPREASRMIINQPFDAVNGAGRYDVHANICGGGLSGQADALRHGIARALEKFDETLRAPLKKKGFLTRDARKKERKKYGQRGARARFQFSKR